ncbi:DUF2156 domain-containing protein [Lapillicoccus sp.]|uniref:bifunctional lysylphosphatidylglycerol flippase/synthetase MprF n=1 Tax=Lapillicoccus sp. TaxID=1909287 RepID=UPI0025F33BD9|nr:DUF2156 domain-containing protein [Lapillicoccus sp.]
MTVLVLGATGAVSAGLRAHGLVRLDITTLHPLSVLANLVVAQNPIAYVSSIGALLTCGLIAERLLGSLRYALVLVSIQVVALLVATLHAALIASVFPRWSHALTETPFGGPGSAALGALLVSSAGMSTLWRRRVRAAAVAFVVTAVLYDGDAGGVVTFWAALIGLAAGAVMLPEPAERSPVPKVGEARMLVAIVVACSALGPVVAALSAAAGPLTSLGSLLDLASPSASEVGQVCLHASAAACTFAHVEQHQGLGGVLKACVPSFVLLAIATGLARGRRAAWLASLVATGVMAAASAAVFVILPLLASRGRVGGLGVPPGVGMPERVGQLLTQHALPTLAPLFVLGLLVVSRRLFVIRAPAVQYQRLAKRCALILVGASAAYVGIGLLFGDDWSPSASAAALARDLVMRLLPLDLFGADQPTLLPVGTDAVFLFYWIGPLTWAAVLLLVAHALRVDVDPGRAEHERLRALLTASGGGPLSWMATWAGIHHWFSSAGTAAVGYRLERGVALTVGDPIGGAATHHEVLREFAAHCDRMGWTPCFYSAGAEFAALAREDGWKTLQVAEETRLPLGAIAFSGRQFQDIRTAMNHAGREGLTIEWTHLASTPERLAAQVRWICHDWLTAQALPELGFTLGGLAQMLDPAVRCELVVDAEGTVHAVASWLPIHQDGEVVGWTLDVMRRRSTGFRGSIELLIGQAVLDFQCEGYAVMSLSGAPLARVERPDAASAAQDGFAPPLDRLLDIIGRTLEPVYGFQSLLRFKAKFQPEFRPMYIVYPDPTNLPNIGQAVARAYLPDAGRGSWWRLASTIATARRRSRASAPAAPVPDRPSRVA